MNGSSVGGLSAPCRGAFSLSDSLSKKDVLCFVTSEPILTLALSPTGEREGWGGSSCKRTNDVCTSSTLWHQTLAKR